MRFSILIRRSRLRRGASPLTDSLQKTPYALGRHLRSSARRTRHADGARPRPSAGPTRIKPNKTKQKSLDFLGFIRPNRDFSMGYGESSKKSSGGVSRDVQNVLTARSPSFSLTPRRPNPESRRRVERDMAWISIFSKHYFEFF
jgi:hypothetical protein